jgi:hypothetical protein
VFSFKHQPLRPWENSLNYLLDKRLVDSQRRSECCVPESLPGTESRFLSYPARNLVYICLSVTVQPLTAFSLSCSFTQSVGHLGRVISPSQGSYLYTAQHRQNKCTQTSMLQVGFESTIPAFDRAKTVHAVERAAMRSAPSRYADWDIPSLSSAFCTEKMLA